MRVSPFATPGWYKTARLGHLYPRGNGDQFPQRLGRGSFLAKQPDQRSHCALASL